MTTTVTVDGINSAMPPEVIKDAVKFYAKLLGLAKMNIHVMVDSESDMEAQAFTNTLGPDSKKNHREFSIELNSSIPFDEQLSALAHEMVHVKQFARNELRMGSAIRANKVTKEIDLGPAGEWQGKTYDIGPDNYWFLPWEIEAYGREVGLKYLYITSKDEK
jgi:hypothetical protein